MERPDNFRINFNHPLAKSLIFAGLGYECGSLLYIDSSLYSRCGELINMTSTTSSSWIPTLNRFAYNFVAANNSRIVTKYFNISTYAMSMFCWINPINSGTKEIIQHGIYVSPGPASRNFEIYQANTTISWRGGGSSPRVDGNKALTYGTWSCVGGIIIKTIGFVYSNGSLLNTGAIVEIGSNYYPLTIGAYDDGQFPFNGSIADILIYNRPISDTEIKQISDPNNSMLSGMLLPPRRKSFVGVTFKKKRFLVIKSLKLSGVY